MAKLFYPQISTGGLDFHSCDTRDYPGGFGNFSPFTCGVPSPDSSEGEFYLSALGPGDTLAANFAISIDAELKGVPEPITLPLFATGLGLMALLAWRKRRGRSSPLTLDVKIRQREVPYGKTTPVPDRRKGSRPYR